MKMSRLIPLLRLHHQAHARTFIATRQQSKETSKNEGHDSTPGWSGRHGEDHAVNRTNELDVQSQSSQEAMRSQDKGKEGSQSISRKDESNSHEKTKKEHPEAPVTIGMQDGLFITSGVAFVANPLLQNVAAREYIKHMSPRQGSLNGHGGILGVGKMYKESLASKSPSNMEGQYIIFANSNNIILCDSPPTIPFYERNWSIAHYLP